ncbi:2-deoxyribose-5-phosphate aldolase [Ferroacidibacillus organovorans]|uniref:Deoxyribose-phosphate aldolase n=1 Tax=Ferroacidibacillus organovorans TaxID=1765683 RepID=A0A101XTX8_9BACL|nr:deoxyribose-phosphate aldolase [Ferroacidibacillus organovorans]KUO97493.1 2-deoxyribose-5-phosphate aldolase [Ferroacidibacillus organovorans]
MLRAKGETLTSLADCIDHTLLSPQATPSEVDRLCREALCYEFKSVCVNPLYVRACRQKLAGSVVEVCTVIGFPLGATGLENKVAEARQALLDGATELDMVVAIGLLKAGHTDAVLEEIRAVVDAAKGRAIVKVILETPLLSPEQQQLGAELCKQAGADFVKTCTGFAGGATVEAVELLRRTVGSELLVKASGGIRDRATAMKMIEAGASRIGASAGPALCREPLAN